MKIFEYISKDITIDQEAEIVGLENEKLLKLLYIDSLYSEWLSYGDWKSSLKIIKLFYKELFVWENIVNLYL